jgi:hypothetical protein
MHLHRQNRFRAAACAFIADRGQSCNQLVRGGRDQPRLRFRWREQPNAAEIAARLLKFEPYCLRRAKGKTMNIRNSARYPKSRAELAVHDILIVSAFGAWALLLGLSPVLVFHALT